MISKEELVLLLSLTNDLAPLSKLGFFSVPSKVQSADGRYWVLKKYKPVKDFKLVSTIDLNHASYVSEMSNLGVLIPETSLFLFTDKTNHHQMVVVQEFFEQEELVRSILERCSLDQFLDILQMILSDVLKYWHSKKDKVIGFHPTLRNYSLRGDKLYYFDTFPPMLMPQMQLNRILLKMAPLLIDASLIIPVRLANRVSDEYYYIDKMLAGIVGSSCRLRPEFSSRILAFAQDVVANTRKLTSSEIHSTLRMLSEPPELPFLWTFFRDFFGKEGKPNVKR